MSGASGIKGSAIALGANVATSLYGVTGASVKIGIISDSYDAKGGAGTNVALGYLPQNVTVLNDNPTGSDEGQAMMELAYQIAPGATYYFDAPPASTAAGIAAAVTQLQDEGCNIIIDDLGDPETESAYQIGSPLDQAIENAVTAGIDYFSAAGNDGDDYVQMGFTPLTVDIPGIGEVVANNFGNNSPYLSVTIPTGTDSSNPSTLSLQWAQPFATYGNGSAGAANSLAVYLINDQNQVVASATVDQIGKNPTQVLRYLNTSDSTDFRLVVVENGGVVPAGQIFTLNNANSDVSFDSALAGEGNGNIFGHELLSNTNVVAAASYLTSPALGGTPTITDYSSTGPGVLYFNSNGQPLSTPVTLNEPSFTSVANSITTVPGFGPFTGTSAAAPNAGAVGALMLQANMALTTTELSALLAQSAIPIVAPNSNGGAGLIQARAAVELANAAGGVLWTNPDGGDWAIAADWSSGAEPDSSEAVMLGDDLGTITTSYTVTVASADDRAGSLTLSAPADMTTTLAIVAEGTLSVGGSNADNITAGDFLVAARGQLLVDEGTLDVSGSLNSNDGAVDIEQGFVTASNFAQNSGLLAVGGSSGGASLVLSDTTGISETGGTIAIEANGTISTTSMTATTSTLSILPGGTFIATQNVVLQNVTLTDQGQFETQTLSILACGSVTIGQTGTISTGTLSVSNVSASGNTTILTNVIDNGLLAASGNVGGGAEGGTISIGSTGTLAIGGAASSVNIAFAGGTGLLDYSTDQSSILLGGLTATVFGFGIDSGTIEFGSLAYNPLGNYSYDYDGSSGELDISSGSNPLVGIMLNASAQYDAFSFGEGLDDSLAITAIACFARGTRIKTEQGLIAVEDLRVGLKVMTVAGKAVPITWIGSRTVSCWKHPDPEAVWPVRVSAHAFGQGCPGRDLYLSPDHAIYAEGVLIPIKYLIDGKRVRQIERSNVTYFHVELAQHDILLAEGLAAESYLDTGDRSNFDGGPTVTLHPAWGSARIDPALLMDAEGYAPLRVTGSEVERVRAKLSESAFGALQHVAS